LFSGRPVGGIGVGWLVSFIVWCFQVGYFIIGLFSVILLVG